VTRDIAYDGLFSHCHVIWSFPSSPSHVKPSQTKRQRKPPSIQHRQKALSSTRRTSVQHLLMSDNSCSTIRSLTSDINAHPTVIGLPGDKPSTTDGRAEARQVTQLLHDDGISCCIYGTLALQRYNVRRVRTSVSLPCGSLLSHPSTSSDA
jgi:hypothetical protein